MNRYLHIIFLLAFITAILLLDNYLMRETDYMKELIEIEKSHQRLQASNLERTFDNIFFDNDHLDSLQPTLSIVSSYLDSAIDKSNYLNLKDTFDSNFKANYPKHIWNASLEIIEIQTLEFFNQWMGAQFDSSRFAKWRDPKNYEMVIGYIERNGDSIQFGSHYILPIDSPYLYPLGEEQIIVDSLKVY